MTDIYWMNVAINEAEKAFKLNEVPIGAVLIKDNILIAKNFNRSILLSDPSAHAEILVLRQAGQFLDNYRLTGCTLYTTLEPCMMCMGALIQSRIERLVFGSVDLKSKALFPFNYYFVNHGISCVGPILPDICSHLMRRFFRLRRG